MNKKGQFYLAAAIIIIAVIIGLAGVTNYLRKTDSVKIYDLKDELGIEGTEVLDHGIYNEYNNTEVNNLLKDFTGKYSDYIQKGFSLYFVFGNKDQLVIAAYKDLVTGTVSYQQGESQSILSITQGVYNATTIEKPTTDEVVVKIDETEYSFDLKESGQNFYFVINQKTESGDIYVERG